MFKHWPLISTLVLLSTTAADRLRAHAEVELATHKLEPASAELLAQDVIAAYHVSIWRNGVCVSRNVRFATTEITRFPGCSFINNSCQNFATT